MAKSEYENQLEPTTQVIGQGETGMMLRVKQAELRVVDGPDKGLVKTIPPHGLIVGKTRLCNFMLTDTAVSSQHFRVAPSEQGFVVQDLGSRNGTWFHGSRMREVCVGKMDSFKAGHSTFRLEFPGGHSEFPLSKSPFFGGMLGESVAMRQVFAMLERAANTDSTLLIEGESGTGKDLAAETVHIYSSRKDGPFVVVDCGSMQPNLVESQLFGHCEGAFTGANSDTIGAFEAAEGGTIFLDEIGELDSNMQPKLLRVLEKRQVQRLGESTYRPVHVRLIAATNRDLESDVQRGHFRRDLFYRLSVLRIHMPALRERPEDIPALVSSMIKRLRPNTNLKDVLADDVLGMFTSHDWPGNVRELRNVVERLLLFPEWTAAQYLRKDEGPSTGPSKSIDLPFQNARDMVIEHFEKEYVTSLLDECGGIVAHAAEKARVSRQTMHRLINKYCISTKKLD